MAYCNNGKMWCLPDDLLNSELENMIELLWENFTFYNGSDIVWKMMKNCEYELHQRRKLRTSRNLAEWSRIGWPKHGTPVIEYDFNTNEATVVIFESPLKLQCRENSSSVPPRKTSVSSGLAEREPGASIATSTKIALGLPTSNQASRRPASRTAKGRQT